MPNKLEKKLNKATTKECGGVSASFIHHDFDITEVEQINNVIRMIDYIEGRTETLVDLWKTAIIERVITAKQMETLLENKTFSELFHIGMNELISVNAIAKKHSEHLMNAKGEFIPDMKGYKFATTLMFDLMLVMEESVIELYRNKVLTMKVDDSHESLFKAMKEGYKK